MKGDKITSGYISLAILGVQSWAQRLYKPCLLGSPLHRGQNEKWLDHHGSLGDLEMGGMAT